MAIFSRIDAKHKELKECPRCECEIQQGETHCIRCGLVLDPVVVWMIERQQRNDGHLHDRKCEVSNAIEND
jgi:transcription initiation factor TFIIIB Brf1 subunit/transcription initiation factor TFIIB